MKMGREFNQVDRFTKLVEAGNTAEQIYMLTDIPVPRVLKTAKTLGLVIMTDPEVANLKEEKRIRTLIHHSNIRKEQNRKPASDRNVRKLRKCLFSGCGEEFDSWGAGNQICSNHTSTSFHKDYGFGLGWGCDEVN